MRSTIGKMTALALILVPAGARASSTSFDAFMWVNGTKIELTQAGPIRLPSALLRLGWSCQITPEGLSDDGKKAYRNIACSLGESVVVVDAECAIGKQSFDVGSMSLRTKGMEVTLTISCGTLAQAGGASR